MTKALIVVDVQLDFCEGGALAVAGGNEVAENIRLYLKDQGKQYAFVAFSKDWHKEWPHTNGGHFSDTPDFVDSWPVHCEEGSYGALFHPSIPRAIRYAPAFDVFLKGNGHPDYSAFQGVNHRGHDLDLVLEDYNVDEVDVAGIAGDYCVKQTALTAKRLGYRVNILSALVASVGGKDATLATIHEVENS